MEKNTDKRQWGGARYGSGPKHKFETERCVQIHIGVPESKKEEIKTLFNRYLLRKYGGKK